MMTIGSEEFKKALDEFLAERKPQSFNSMIESLSWYKKMREEFIKMMKEKGELK